ncbi:MAG TPA: hypothetical protein VGH32_07260, partial [Pirellulales bacterium]
SHTVFYRRCYMKKICAFLVLCGFAAFIAGCDKKAGTGTGTSNTTTNASTTTTPDSSTTTTK